MKHLRRAAVPIVCLTAILAMVGQLSAPAEAATGDITEYPLTGSGVATTMAPSLDGNLWFQDQFFNKIGKITTGGTVTMYPVPTPAAGIFDVATGPDGNVWFAEQSAHQVGVITPSGAVTEFPTPGSSPHGIAPGPDGNLWFTDEQTSVGKIGKITPSGVVTLYAGLTSFPREITAGPDGKLWFTENYNGGNSKIGRITTSGTIKEFPLANPLATPTGIAAGPDGNLWFAESCNCVNSIGRITPSGTITEFGVPTANAAPEYVFSGSDGNLWFTEEAASPDKVGRITPTGTITEFTTPSSGAGSLGITMGPDGNEWFSEGGIKKAGRISVAAAATSYALSIDAGFVPKTLKLKKQGTTAQWSFIGAQAHSVTDGSGMGLFDSGTHQPVSFFSYPFVAAGTYSYKDTLRPSHTAKVGVPLVVKLIAGPPDSA